jgi:hypothetical protein
MKIDISRLSRAELEKQLQLTQLSQSALLADNKRLRKLAASRLAALKAYRVPPTAKPKAVKRKAK